MAARMLLLPRLARLSALQHCSRAPLSRHTVALRSRHALSTQPNSTSLAPGAGVQQLATQAAPTHSSHQTQPADHFAARSSADFEALGVSAEIAKALRGAGFPAPARVQELAMPTILAGRDVVLAAETGSGKTLAYLAPVATLLLRNAAGLSEDERKHRKQIALVLCPNAALCQQVVAAASALLGPDGKPLLLACQVSSAHPPPFDTPDIVVTTPGALMTMLYEAGPHYGRLWTEEGLALRVGHVVVDEADLLVSGGYVKDLTRLLDLLKAGERRRIEAQVMRELGMHHEGFQRLSRPIKVACWEGGVPAMLAAGWRPASAADAADGACTATDATEALSTAEEAAGDAEAAASTSGRDKAAQQQQPQYGPYLRRQYIFVAATMPSVTKADAASELQRRYKDATWVSGDLLHKSKPNVSHQWLQVDEDTWAKTLVGVLLEDPDYQQGKARVLVFAKDTSSADKVSDVLRREAIQHVVYHKHVPQEERAAALQTMAAPATTTPPAGNAPTAASNAIMVSTDAAARGIDLPGITHVVQADFAMTAIDFLHRIGRTARAGNAGKVTSLFSEASSDLAGVLREYVEAGKPVEDAFSRKRSFSRKMKRYGKFVPRGSGEGYAKPSLEQRQERRRLMRDNAGLNDDSEDDEAQDSDDGLQWRQQHGNDDGRFAYSDARQSSAGNSSSAATGAWSSRSASREDDDGYDNSSSGRFSREWSPRSSDDAEPRQSPAGSSSSSSREDQPQQWRERSDSASSSRGREWSPRSAGRDPSSTQWDSDQGASSRGARDWSPRSNAREPKRWDKDSSEGSRVQSPRGRGAQYSQWDEADVTSNDSRGSRDDRRWHEGRDSAQERWQGGRSSSGRGQSRSAGGRQWEGERSSGGGRQDRGPSSGRGGQGRWDDREDRQQGGRQQWGGADDEGEHGGRGGRQDRGPSSGSFGQGRWEDREDRRQGGRQEWGGADDGGEGWQGRASSRWQEEGRGEGEGRDGGWSGRGRGGGRGGRGGGRQAQGRPWEQRGKRGR